MINPVPSARHWVKAPENPINPPAVKKMPHRPKKMRNRSADKPKKGPVSTRKRLVVHCKRCLLPNHNSQCKNMRECNSSKVQILKRHLKYKLFSNQQIHKQNQFLNIKLQQYLNSKLKYNKLKLPGLHIQSKLAKEKGMYSTYHVKYEQSCPQESRFFLSLHPWQEIMVIGKGESIPVAKAKGAATNTQQFGKRVRLPTVPSVLQKLRVKRAKTTPAT